MKPSRRKRRAREIRAGFVRGFVAAGLLAAIQERAAGGACVESRRLLRLALQGGGAMAAGVAAAESLAEGRWAAALGAAAAGGAGVLAIERLLSEITFTEKPHGQEEAG